MSFGLYDRERRRRRQALLAVGKAVLYLGVVGAAGLFSYQFAVERVKGSDAQLRAEIERLSDENAQLATAVQQLQSLARAAETRAQEIERRYAQDVPRGDHARLLQAARERLAAGVSADRVAFVLANADEPTDCGQPDTRRFVVLTPIGQAGPNNAVRFGDGALTVSAQGESARARDGSPEAWFDPTQPVSVRFTPLGGRNETTASGVLPISHALVVNNSEWRFSVHAGPRSFVEVTATRCGYP
jgi:cell division protein FtsB